MRFKIVYQFLTGEKITARARGKKLYGVILEEHLNQRRNNDNETNKHVPYISCETFDTEELICDDPRWDGLFLSPEKVFFHHLWLAEQEERLKKLQRVMRRLTKSQRKLIRQIYRNNMEFDEIAEAEECDLSGIYKKHDRILNFLRSQF